MSKANPASDDPIDGERLDKNNFETFGCLSRNVRACGNDRFCLSLEKKRYNSRWKTTRLETESEKRKFGLWKSGVRATLILIFQINQCHEAGESMIVTILCSPSS
jgi:hypothetical protein